MPAFLRNLTYEGVPVWRHAHIVQLTVQIVSGVAVVALVIWFVANIGLAIDSRNIPVGFGFLDTEYQTPIGEHFIPYDKASDTYQHALLVAAVNTLVVAVTGIILATILGIVIGVARLSSNWLVAKLALVFVEFFRNVPLLVQLLFWLFIVLELPQVREGLVFWDTLYVNNSGISVPGPSGIGSLPIFLAWVGFAVLGIAAGVLVNRRLVQRELAMGGVAHPVLSGWTVALAVIVVSYLLLSVVGTSPIEWSIPGPEGRFERIANGFTLRAGLMVMLLGLTMYTASFIAEIVRGGIQSVGKGQVEAGRALGLTPMGALRSVIFPQALRVIIPPLISQYLNLTKNSSLGAAVAYPELAGVGVTMTQRESAISIFILIMLSYLAMSLTWSLIGNLYNRYISFERRR